MNHYIPLQSASLWTETEPVAPAKKNHGSILVFAAAAITLIFPVGLAYVAWDPNSAAYADAMHWVEGLRYSIGL